MGHLITPCFNVHCMLKRSEGGLEKACMFNGFLCFRYLSFALLLPEAFGTSADVIFWWVLVNISLPILQALLVVPCRAVGWCRYNCCGLFTVQTLGPLGQSASRNSTRFVWESQLGLSTSVHKTNRTNSSKYSKLDSRTLNGPQQ